MVYLAKAGPSRYHAYGMTLKILIVDDHEETAKVIEEGLRYVCEKEGCSSEFSIIHDGETVSDVHQREAYDLIIVDLMPTGMEVIKQIRKFDTVVSFIIITGNPSLETAIEAIQLKVFAYMSKPFTLSELATQAQNAVAHSLVKKKLLSLANTATKTLKRNGKTHG